MLVGCKSLANTVRIRVGAKLMAQRGRELVKEEEEEFAILDLVSVTEVSLKERPIGGEEPVEQLSGEECSSQREPQLCARNAGEASQGGQPRRACSQRRAIERTLTSMLCCENSGGP